MSEGAGRSIENAVLWGALQDGALGGETSTERTQQLHVGLRNVS